MSSVLVSPTQPESAPRALQRAGTLPPPVALRHARPRGDPEGPEPDPADGLPPTASERGLLVTAAIINPAHWRTRPVSHGARGAGAGLRPPATLPTYYCIRHGSRNSLPRPRSSSSHAAVALPYRAPLSGHYVPGPLSPWQGSCFAMLFAQRAEKRALAAVNTPTTMGLAVSSKLSGLVLCAWIEHRAKPRVFTSRPCTRVFQVWALGARVRALRGHNLGRTCAHEVRMCALSSSLVTATRWE